MIDVDRIRREFAVTRQFNFLDHACVAPICGRAADAMRRYIDHATLHAAVDGVMFEEAHRIRTAAARLINADAAEVTFVKNTSEGLGFVANGLHFSHGDNIVTTACEFPANIYPWKNLQSAGVRLKMVPEDNGRVDVGRLIESIDSRTRVVTVSSVQYASGYRMDLATLGRACKEKGVFLVVDAIQSLGCIPCDVKAMNIDFLAADGHKWLLGPEGAGVFYCSRELIGHLRPSCVGWLSMKDEREFGRFHFELREDARRFDAGSYNLVGIHGLGGALAMFEELGVAEVWTRVRELTDRLVAGVREKGYRVISSRSPGEESGIVAFISDHHNHEQICRHLREEHRTIISVRAGRLRASPHFYNTPDEIDQLVRNLPGPARS
jgi:selenocysteine lyase/cysteine desulfurase